MTVKTATIEDIINVRPYENKYGTTYYYTIVMDNGDQGSWGKKSDDAFSVGQRVTYLREETERGVVFKNPPQDFPRNGAGGATQAARQAPRGHQGEDRNRSFALAYAKDLVVALVAGRDIKSSEAAEVTVKVADRFLEWLAKDQ